MKILVRGFSLIEVMISLIILAILLTVLTNTSVGTAFFIKSVNQSSKILNKPEIGLALFQADISHSIGHINSEFLGDSGKVSFIRLLIDSHLLTPRAVIMQYEFGKIGIRRKLKLSHSDDWNISLISDQTYTTKFETCFLSCEVSKLVLIDETTGKERIVLYNGN